MAAEHSGDRSASAEHDGGYSLVEVVATIALMGTALAAILGAIGMAIRVSQRNDEHSKVEAVLTSAADRLTGYAYLPCPELDPRGGYLPIVQAAAGTVDWATSTVQIVGIQYWVPTSGAGGAWQDTNGLSGSECNASVGLTTGRTLQKVAIRVSGPSTGYSRTLEVVKSNVFPKPVAA